MSVSISVFITAYGFQMILFPTLHSMRDKSNEGGIKAVSLSVGMSMSIYMIFSILGMYTFGSSLRPDILDNVGEDGYSWESIF